MRNNLQKFYKPLMSVTKALNQLDREGIEVKAIAVNDVGVPSIQVYNSEKLKKLIKQQMTMVINVDYRVEEIKNNSSCLYLRGCRLIWSN